MFQTPASLRIAVLGAGAIGSAFALRLARHHEVTAIARPGSARLEQLRRDGGIVTVKGERSAVRVLDALDEETPYDLVIVTVLGHQVGALLPTLQRSAARAIQFMFNSFEPERLAEAVGAQRASFGMPFVQSSLDAEGHLNASIGAGGQRSIMSDPRWAAVFEAAGLPARVEPNMPLWLRCHVPICVAFESVSVAGERRGGGAAWGEAMTIALGVKESFGLIRGLGFPLYPRATARIAALPPTAVATLLWLLSRVRSFRELLATGDAECRALVDIMLEAAPRAGRAVRVARLAALKPS